jgi:uncharacterized protein (UPF0332 family)
VKEFARSEWQRAQRAIKTAATLIESDPESATSRAYYAAFHALTAVFALRGQSFSKHAALRGALHKDLIKTGQWPVELGKDYDFLMDLREIGDYGGVGRVSEQDARCAVEAAQRIIAACQEKLSSFD